MAVPKTPNPIKAFEGHLSRAQMKEKCWLEYLLKMIENDELDKRDIVAWSTYHAPLHNMSDDLLPTLTQLLSLFNEKAACMIKYGMDVQREATVSESKTDPSNGCGCTSVCTGQIYSVELASNAW